MEHSEKRTILHAVALAALALAGAAVPFFSISAPLSLFALAFFMLIQKQIEYGIYLLLLVSFLTAFSVEAGPFTIRPDQAVAVFLAPLLVLQVVAGRRRLILGSLEAAILLYVLANLISSAVNSPDLSLSLRRCLHLAITVSAYFLATHLISNERALWTTIRFFVAAGILEALFGIVSVPLFAAGITTGGAERPYGPQVYARGTFFEGNLFGSFQMMLALILLAFFFHPQYKKHWKGISAAMTVVITAALMSFSRAAWLGFLVGGLFYAFSLNRRFLSLLLRNIGLIAVFLLLAGASVYLLFGSVRIGGDSLLDLVQQRMERIVESRVGTGSFRLQVWKESILLWQQHPILGNGADSIKVLGAKTSMRMFGEGYWIPNSLILVLHDTGAIGIVIFLAIQFLFLVQLWNSRRATLEPKYQALLDGMMAAFVGAQFAYLFTNAFWLIYIWLFMGIGIAAARLAPRRGVGSPPSTCDPNSQQAG